jgi:hypothetical protein
VTTKHLCKAAFRLHTYLEFRAQQEQQRYELTESFFAKMLRMGIRTFFGITVSESGIILDDVQNPAALAAFTGGSSVVRRSQCQVLSPVEHG